ncbi:MAG: SUMF1/EgtB/PvdO family nonheme iron enzyme [Ktedonobacteraceae bacterium]|nr:SUMF1/EgtB/PvdO family nonheme iron enzyme [Ktedonobacteraceae bacterium]MBA3822471.1 SUMF1/EgtB/PvdO family nonheme iron enzyme [Ktedonobacterales bacterium]
MPTYHTVFISYSHVYSSIVEQLKQDIRAHGIVVWIDHESLAPGTPDWDNAIRKGIRLADVILYMAAPEALQSPWVKGELAVAMRNGKPIIPLWLAGKHWVDVVPLNMSNMQYIDARNGHYLQTLQQLLASLGVTKNTNFIRPTIVMSLLAPQIRAYPVLARLDGLGFEGWRNANGTAYIIPPMVEVSAGKFIMGSSQDDTEAYDNEKPQYAIHTDSFYVGKYPVTVAEYSCAIESREVPKLPNPYQNEFIEWEQQLQRPDNPVLGISWVAAVEYCKWFSKVTGQHWRLPKETEWEKAARWDSTKGCSRLYPWGNQFDESRFDSRAGKGIASPVASYAEKNDASPYDCHEMVGNICEWTSTLWYERPPYDEKKYENDADLKSSRVLRGGWLVYERRNVRAAYRVNLRPESGNGSDVIGFRLVMDT